MFFTFRYEAISRSYRPCANKGRVVDPPRASLPSDCFDRDRTTATTTRVALLTGAPVYSSLVSMWVWRSWDVPWDFITVYKKGGSINYLFIANVLFSQKYLKQIRNDVLLLRLKGVSRIGIKIKKIYKQYLN